MKVKLYLHGHLRDKVQKDFVEVEANTLLDALKNLEMRYRKVLKAPMDIGRWKIKVKGFDDKNSWTVPIFVDEVHIYPVFRMGKSQKTSGWVNVIVGTTLVIAGVVIATLGGSPEVGIPLAMSGFSMFVQGILTLFFTPKNDTDDGTNSKYLGAGQNTVKSGTRIPFGYGTFKVAGQILSYNVSSSNIRVYGD